MPSICSCNMFDKVNVIPDACLMGLLQRKGSGDLVELLGSQAEKVIFVSYLIFLTAVNFTMRLIVVILPK